jgi:recombination protein RecT
MLILSETLDKDKRPVLESCSQVSIANSLLKMITFGLSPSKGQVYFIAFNGTLSIMKSYMGNMAIAKRVGNVKTVNANVIYKDDIFEYGVNIEDGSMEVKKHETSFASIDSSEIIGVYAIVVFKDGSKKVDVMTAKQVQTSFEQSYTKGNSPAHLKFKQAMFQKTVINRVLKTIIGSSDDSNLYEEKEVPTTEEIVEEEISEYANSEIIDLESNIKMCELAEKIHTLSGGTERLLFETVKQYQNDVQVRLPSINKLNSTFGIQQFQSVDQTIEKCINILTNVTSN